MKSLTITSLHIKIVLLQNYIIVTKLINLQLMSSILFRRLLILFDIIIILMYNLITKIKYFWNDFNSLDLYSL